MKQLVVALMGIIFTRSKQKKKLLSEEKENQEHDSRDRLSELPEEVIHRIMSFLPSPTDTFRISLLSKHLNSVWRRFTTLVFDQILYENAGSSSKSKHREISLLTFLNLVHDSLRRCDCAMNIENLTLRGCLRDWDCAPTYAIERHVKQLKVDYACFSNGIERPDPYPHRTAYRLYHVPQGLYSAKSITSLYLKGLSLRPGRHITLRCPRLENLSLVGCNGIKGVTLQCPKLKAVELLKCLYLTEIHIDIDGNLQYFSYHGLRSVSAIIHDSIEKASCRSLIKVAELRDADGTVKENRLELLRCVEKLNLQGCLLYPSSNQPWCLGNLTSLEVAEYVSVPKLLRAPNLGLLEYRADKERQYALNLSSSNAMLHVKLHYAKARYDSPLFTSMHYEDRYCPGGLKFYVYLKTLPPDPSAVLAKYSP